MTGKFWVGAYLLTVSILFLLTYIFIIFAEEYYPLRISENVAFDAKIRFLKKSKRLNSSDTIVIGSSMGLINLNGEVLEEKSRSITQVANLSAWGDQVLQTEQILQLIEDGDVKYVIFPLQMTDFSKDKKYDVNFDELKKYIEDKFTLHLYNKVFFNMFNFLKVFYNYKSFHLVENTYPCLLFDKTGGISYRIYGEDIDQEKWEDNRIFGLNMKNFAALERMAKTITAKNIKFIVATTPLRLPLLARSPEWEGQYNKFSNLMEEHATENGYHYLNLHQELLLNDVFFADSSHMNYEGSVILSQRIAEYIDSI
jgi:hypothetical protein